MEAMEPNIVSEAGGSPAQRARCGGRAELATLLRNTRTRTLRLLDAYEAALGPALPVPQADGLNPPLWELGHIGWFADRWIARNPQRALGTMADPHAPLAPARQGTRGVDADALYDSSAVPHGARWHLSLPDLPATREDLQAQLDDTVALLQDGGIDNTNETDEGLYFFRLALFHEAMHAEAWVYMAQRLGIDVGEPAPPPTAPRDAPLHLPAGEWAQGWPGAGFAFDNELRGEVVSIGAFDIDAQPVHWARYLPAVRAGAVPLPRHLRHVDGQWQQRVHGKWRALDLLAPACHLSCHEALAWCAWAGRRLPTEVEWEYAAHHAEGFDWGSVWEWTASAFAPLAGFKPHPYRDYSQPWFDGRPVLKGACHATAACMRHPRYRNFFTADRTDIFAGFRSVGRAA
jgi:EgtB-related family protein